MADFTSTNSGLGGLYQAGFNIDPDRIEWISFDDRNIPANQVETGEIDNIDYIDISDDDAIRLDITSRIQGDDIEPLAEKTVTITIPEHQRFKFSQYLRDIADMLERNA